jgi:hypothetical protein
MTLRFMATRASAYLPIAMSIASLGVVALALIFGPLRAPDGDEGLYARLWQLLIVGQLPVVLYFMLRWLPRAPREGALVVIAQLTAGVVALLPVLVLHL